MANRANLLTKMTCERQTKLKILSKNISAFTGMKRETRAIFGEERNVILTSFIYRKLNTYIRELKSVEVFRNHPESDLFAVMVGWLHDRRLLKLPHSTTQTSANAVFSSPQFNSSIAAQWMSEKGNDDLRKLKDMAELSV